IWDTSWERVVAAVVVNDLVFDPTVSENVPAPTRSEPPANVEALAAWWAAASWSTVKLTVPSAGVPVTEAATAPEDDVAVTIAPMPEALVRAAAADCRAESLPRTAVQALTWPWYVATWFCIRVIGACSIDISSVMILLVS